MACGAAAAASLPGCCFNLTKKEREKAKPAVACFLLRAAVVSISASCWGGAASFGLPDFGAYLVKKPRPPPLPPLSLVGGGWRLVPDARVTLIKVIDVWNQAPARPACLVTRKAAAIESGSPAPFPTPPLPRRPEAIM